MATSKSGFERAVDVLKRAALPTAVAVAVSVYFGAPISVNTILIPLGVQIASVQFTEIFGKGSKASYFVNTATTTAITRHFAGGVTDSLGKDIAAELVGSVVNILS